jgi:hypothetical protein
MGGENNAQNLEELARRIEAASRWLLFISGVLLGTALQRRRASEKEQFGREGSIQGISVRTQAWLGFAGTVLAALITLIGNLIALYTGQ